jgi:UDP-N-acetylmuramate dehydrogenase
MNDDITRPSDADLSRIGALLGDRAVRDEPLGTYTTYRVGGPAAIFVRATGVEDLHAVARALARVPVPVLVLGRGSNTLVADAGFRGLVVLLGPFAERVAVPEPGSPPVVTVGAHASLPVVARQCAAAGLTGFEWAVGVPGSVGGAVRMNAGGHGSDMAASLRHVRLLDLRRDIEAHAPASELGLRFRGSDLTDDQVVLSATLALAWGDRAACEARISEIVRWRREHQPGGQNAGSVFVNPGARDDDAPSAGRLIDEAGLRGRRLGSAEVSTKHANFIQADEGGSADDVVELMAWVRARIAEHHGVNLRSEIRLVGFSPTVAMAAGHSPARSAARGATRLDALLDAGRAADGSVPVPRWDDVVPPAVLAELRDAFEGQDPTTGGLRVVPPPASVVPPASAAPSVADPPPAPRAPLVIVDDDLRLPTDEDFPGDAQARTVHLAPTTSPEAAEIVPLRRQRRRARARWVLAVAGLALGLTVVAALVLATPLAGIRQVDVEGARSMNPVVLEAVSDALRGTSIFAADLAAAQRQLEGDPWVRSARLRTYLPSRVVIEISEREPVAWFVGVDNRARVLDVDGRVLAVVDGQPTEYLQVTGVGANLAPGAVAGEAYRAAAQLAVMLPEGLRGRVATVGVAGPAQLTLTMRGGTYVNFGAPSALFDKLVTLVTLLERQDPASIVAIDLADPRAPAVQSK